MEFYRHSTGGISLVSSNLFSHLFLIGVLSMQFIVSLLFRAVINVNTTNSYHHSRPNHSLEYNASLQKKISGEGI